MITSPLLSYVRHRAMITLVSLLLTRLNRIKTELLDNLSFVWNSFRNGNGFLDWTAKPMFNTNPLLQKTFSPIRIMFKKLLNCIGQLGLWWMSPSKARANEVERTPTNDIVLFRSPATWTRMARHETQIYEQWQPTRSKEKSPS